MYRPPVGLRYLSKNFAFIIQQNLSLGIDGSKEVIIMGDLNVNYLKKNEDTHIKRVITTHSFTQLIDKPTRVTKDSSTLIDNCNKQYKEHYKLVFTFVNGANHVEKGKNCTDF